MLLTGCGKKAPGCSENKVQKLVIQIVRQGLIPLLGEKGATTIKIKLQAIRTVELDKETGKYTCQANMLSEIEDKHLEKEIVYTSELVDDGRDFYVSVYR